MGQTVGFTYDSGIVALSIALAILGIFTGLIMTAGLRAVRGREALFRTLLGGVGIGGGIWSMQYIAILAVIAPVEISYDPASAFLSAILVIVFASVALGVVRQRRFGRYTLMASVVFLGAGLAAADVLGMNGMRGNFTLAIWWPGTAVSILIALQTAALALWLAFRRRGVIETGLGAVALGLAAASMHYAGMEAVTVLPSAAAGESGGGSNAHLALAVALGMYCVCGLCIFAFTMLSFKRKRHSSMVT